MAGDSGTSDFPLIARRCHNDSTVMGCVIQRLLQLVLTFR
jgi:hypothetical protein